MLTRPVSTRSPHRCTSTPKGSATQRVDHRLGELHLELRREPRAGKVGAALHDRVHVVAVEADDRLAHLRLLHVRDQRQVLLEISGEIAGQLALAYAALARRTADPKAPGTRVDEELEA